MNSEIFQQLAELAQSFKKIGVKPVICGGLGVYLCFHKSLEEVQQMIRATNDIDLMLTPTQVLEQSRRNAIAEIIRDELNYVVREDSKHFRFQKEPDQQLDILVPPIEGIKTEGSRVKLSSSKLHGRVTNEARFIGEDLRTISLSDILADKEKACGLEVQVPSPANQLILKLFAFDDRDEGQRQDVERAQAHVWDIYIIIMLTSKNDYLEGQRFLLRHKDSDIIKRVLSIVSSKFSAVDQTGWQCVLEASAFYPDLNRKEKGVRLDVASRRLVRWFDLSPLQNL